MKLKNYIIIGYLISTTLTILAVFWAVQKMYGCFIYHIHLLHFSGSLE